MRTLSDRAARGYSLLGVVLLALIVAIGATATIVMTREASAASNLDRKNGDAYAAALAGLTWAQANLDSAAGKAALTAASSGTTTAVAGINVHRFDPDDAHAGVGASPPAAGVSSADWIAFHTSHFGITAAKEPLANSGFVVRVVGQNGDTQVVLETNIKVNTLRSLPAGLTGCFSGPVQITFYDQESPYDYYGNARYDGNGGVPIGMSEDHDRMNGLARYNDSSTSVPADVAPADPVAGYATGRRWRGTQSLRGEPIATGVENGKGGLPATHLRDDNAGPVSGWAGNPYMANDPRVADVNDGTARGLGLNDKGLVDGVALNATAQRGLPIIAYIGTPGAAGGFTGDDPTNANGFLRAEENWAPISKDNRSRKGFYACDNHDGENSTAVHAVDACITGTASATGATAVADAADWTKAGLNHSGRAWGFVSSVVRQCTGSGDSIDSTNGQPWQSGTNPNGIKCNPAFSWLENMAACLVVPRQVAGAYPAGNTVIARGTNAKRPSGCGGAVAGKCAGAEAAGGDADLSNDFRGCHPGCLVAGDEDADGTAEHPYRSFCINLDPEHVTTYGPDIQQLRADRIAAVDYAKTAPADTTYTPALYLDNWQHYANTARPADVSTDAPLAIAADKAVDGTGNVIRLPGSISERGNPSLITRLDMTDRGPLGTCQQNCLGYGFGKDSTFGAHNTGGAVAPSVNAGVNCSAVVPTETGTTTVKCNLDYDYDGRMDRKSYAIASSYREECADDNDGLAWGPGFNISSANERINASGGCANDLPNFTGGTPPPLTPFCNQGDLAAIQQSIAQLMSNATTLTSVAALQAKGTLTDEGNWWGGAKCHMGSSIGSYVGRAAPTLHPHAGSLSGMPDTDTDAFGHPDYWIEDTCDTQEVVVLDKASVGTGTLNVGHICGCGVLIIKDMVLNFGDGSHFLWRGLVTWELSTVSGEVLKASTAGFSTFLVEGGTLMTGNQDFQIKITRDENDASVIDNDDSSALKLYFRNNPDALTDVFNGVGAALQGFRKL
jgi:hypothetical protein